MPQERYYSSLGKLVSLVVLDEAVPNPNQPGLANYVVSRIHTMGLGETMATYTVLEPPVSVKNVENLLGLQLSDHITQDQFVTECLKRMNITLISEEDSKKWEEARLEQIRKNAAEGNNIVSGVRDERDYSVSKYPDRIIALTKERGEIKAVAHARQPNAWEIAQMTAALRRQGVKITENSSGEDVPRNLGDW